MNEHETSTSVAFMKGVASQLLLPGYMICTGRMQEEARISSQEHASRQHPHSQHHSAENGLHRSQAHEAGDRASQEQAALQKLCRGHIHILEVYGLD